MESARIEIVTIHSCCSRSAETSPWVQRCRGRFCLPSLCGNSSFRQTPFPRPSDSEVLSSLHLHQEPTNTWALLPSSMEQRAVFTACTTRMCCNSQPHMSAWVSGGPAPRLLLACTASFMLLTFPRNSKWQNRRYCNLELLTFVNWWEYWNVHVPYLTAPPAFLIRCSAQPLRIRIRQLTSGLNIY